MPRAGTNTFEVVASGAERADEAGIGSVSLAALAGRGCQGTALYKHVGGIGDLQHRIATLVMTELGDAERAPGQVRGGRDRRAIHGAPVLHNNYCVYEFSEGVTHVKLVFQDQAFSFELLRVVCKF